MEFNNIQSGQEFASVNVSTFRSSAAVVKPLSEIESATNKRQSSESEQLSINAESVRASEEKAQANVFDADNLNETTTSSKVRQAVVEIESFLQTQNRNLAFDIDENSKRPIVTVKDSTSGDVIRQIPSEEVLKMADRIRELQEDVGSRVGVFVNSQA